MISLTELFRKKERSELFAGKSVNGVFLLIERIDRGQRFSFFFFFSIRSKWASGPTHQFLAKHIIK